MWRPPAKTECTKPTPDCFSVDPSVVTFVEAYIQRTKSLKGDAKCVSYIRRQREKMESGMLR